MSVTSRSPTSDRIEVHTPEILDEITTDVRDDPFYNTKSSWHRHYNTDVSKFSRPKSKSTSSARSLSVRKTSSQIPDCKVQSWLNEDSVRDVQDKTSHGSRSIRNIYTTVLDNEDVLSQDLERYLEFNDIANENKKQVLHKKWTERVYTPLKEQIDKEMGGDNYRKFMKNKNELYQKYLDYRNKKGVVFLDVYSPNEYNPMELNNPRPGPLKAKVKNIDYHDPLCFQDYKRTVEDEEMLRCTTGRTTNLKEVKTYNQPIERLVPLGRANTTCHTWLKMPIHDIDSSPRLKSRQKMRWSSNASQIDFDKWQRPMASPTNLKIIDLELQSQKKRYYPEKYASRQILEWPQPSPNLSTQYIVTN